MVMKKENNKWYIGWIFFPAWYLIGKKYIILPVIQSVFEETSYSDAYLITNYLWNLIAIVILFSLYGTGVLRDIKQIRQYDIKSIASGYIKSFAVIVFIERKRDMRKKYFDYIIVPICAIVCFIMCLKEQNNKIALIIGGGCIGMQIVLLIDGIEKCIKEQKNKDK